METDGVSAEVLYPTLGLRLFAMEDAECQEACFEIANDWMIDYCKVTPGRLFGIPMISLYNIKNAIKELERCKKAGMVGCLVWQVPPEHLSFKTDYYDPFWEAAAELDMPVNLHILTGFNYSRFERQGLDTYKTAVNEKLNDAANTLVRSDFHRRCCRVIRNSNWSMSKTNAPGCLSTCMNGTSITLASRTKVPLPFMKKLPGEYCTSKSMHVFQRSDRRSC